MTASEIALTETLDFLGAMLKKGSRVLEVGAGNCALAARLAWRGIRMTALDLRLPPDRPAVPNLETIEGDFLDFAVKDPKDRFDAVVFTSSLHHLYPLERALDRARDLLLPGGALIAEEFSLDAPDAATLRWYYDAEDLLKVAGLFEGHGHMHAGHDPAEPAFEEPVERWRREHEEDPPLSSGAYMIAEIGARFDALEVVPGPYLYRSLTRHLERAEKGEAIARHLLALERQRIGAGALRPVGLRISAHKRR